MYDNSIKGLLAASAYFGNDITLVQGAGGNISIKIAGALWVKASGKRLGQALAEAILLPLDLDRLLKQLETAASDQEAIEGTEIPCEFPSGRLKPSIEATLHAVMPQAVVLHLHCVNTIAWAVRADGPSALGAMLKGFHWAWVPYARPGLKLTRTIQTHVKSGENVLVLENHGLVVAADSVDAAMALLRDVRARLIAIERAAPSMNLEALAAYTADGTYRLPTHPFVHSLALDPVSTAYTSLGTLYPDHVVFLGHGTAVMQSTEAPITAARRIAGEFGGPLEPKIVLVPGVGVVLHKDAGPSADEMALCLAMIVARIPEGVPLKILTKEQEADLVNWDAEKYRQATNS